MQNNKSKLSSSLLLSALVSFPVMGSAEGTWGGLTDKSKWDVSLGLGLMYKPIYDGDDDMEVNVFPGIDVEWNERLFMRGKEIGTYLYRTEDFSITTGIGFAIGRDESDSIDLRGLGDVSSTATFNLGLEYEIGFLETSLEIEKHLGGTSGMEIELGAEVMYPIFGEGEGMPMMSVGVFTEWADSNYTSDFFGITSTQSLRSGLIPYTASSGFKSTGVELGLLYPISEKWMVRSMLTYSRLLGDAADSPIVKDKSQFEAGLFLMYEFFLDHFLLLDVTRYWRYFMKNTGLIIFLLMSVSVTLNFSKADSTFLVKHPQKKGVGECFEETYNRDEEREDYLDQMINMHYSLIL